MPAKNTCSVNDCTKGGRIRRGLCSLHYQRLRNHGDTAVVLTTYGQPAGKRFWDRVDKSGECWLWTGGTSNGYGMFWNDGGNIWAHRYSFALAYGEIDGSVAVCHRCDTPLCVRPDHLFAGTRRINNLDRDMKQRQARGESSGTRKLSNNSVLEIRESAATGASIDALARQFTVHRNTIIHVITRKTWAHI